MSPLTQQDRDLLAAFLDPHRTLVELAAIGRMNIADLLAWAESERIAPILASLQRMVHLRATLIAGDRSPAALRALDDCLKQPTGPAESRRTAATILRAATRRLPAGRLPGTAAGAGSSHARSADKDHTPSATRHLARPDSAQHSAAAPARRTSTRTPELSSDPLEFAPPGGSSPISRLVQTAGQAKLPRAG